MKKLLIPLLAIGLFTIPTIASAAGPTWGASAPYFGGSNTYGYSWAGYEGHYCETTTSIGGHEWHDASDPTEGWAQTYGCSWPGNWNVYERHSFR